MFSSNKKPYCYCQSLWGGGGGGRDVVLVPQNRKEKEEKKKKKPNAFKPVPTLPNSTVISYKL
jgi:hypothetical protein